jgi:hypothetical protein
MTTLDSKIVTARKEHTCQSGYRQIQKGDKYERTTIVFDGRIYTWKQCLKCKTAMSKPSDRDGLYEEERYPEGWAAEDQVGCAE